MDLSLLPTPASEYNKERTGARFTVRSANSPSYSLTRRQGVRKTRGFEEVGERERYGTHAGTNVTNKVEDHTFAGYEARSVKGNCEENKTSGYKMSTKLNQNGSADKTIAEFGTDRNGNCNPASESRGRTDWRRYNLPSRSKSLDWRTGERSPDRDKRAGMFMLSTKRGGEISKKAEGLDERMTGDEGVRGRVMSSVQAYNSVGTSNDGQERNHMSHMSQTLDRASRGNSLPSRLRSQSGTGSDCRGTATTFGPKGGQSILERIEKLYGSAGFGKTEDCSKVRDFSKPVLSYHKETATDLLISPQLRSYERTAGGTFPRRFSSGDKSSLSPVQSTKSFTWTPKDTEISLSPGTSRTSERLSRGQWQRQTHGRFSEERGVHLSRALEDIGTRSLDRARSRYTVAAQIRSTRAAGGITAPPQPSTFSEEDRSVSLRDLSGLCERGGRGSKDQGNVNHGEENAKTNGINRTPRERTMGFKEQEKEKKTNVGAKEKTELKGNSTDEDVFELNPQSITVKTIERKKFPELLSVPSAASVKNKINQFEALTQRSQGLATGQVLPRRAFSVPTQHSRAHDGIKKSGSAKAIGGLRDMWEGLKEGEEAGEKTEEKATLSGKTLGPGRSLSVDEVGLSLGRKEKERNDSVEKEGKEKDSGNNSAKDFHKYSRLKNTLEIPLNGGDQRRRRDFYIDETDFSKVSSPEEASKKPPYSPLSNSSDTKTTPSLVDNEDKTPTNTPTNSSFLSPSAQPENTTPIADSENESTSVLTQAAKTPKPDSPLLHRPLATSSHSDVPSRISPDVDAAYPNRKKQPVWDLNAWVADLNTKIKVWNDEDDSEDDDESTQRDEDSNYDSDSGESSVTITSNMSQSDNRSFCVRWVLLYLYYQISGLMEVFLPVFDPPNFCLSSI